MLCLRIYGKEVKKVSPEEKQVIQRYIKKLITLPYKEIQKRCQALPYVAKSDIIKACFGMQKELDAIEARIKKKGK